MIKSRRSRLATAVAAIGALSLALTACDSGGSTPEPTTTSGGLEFAGQTLSVVASWSGAEQANFEKVLDGFAQATGATVNYTSFGDNGPTFLQSALEGGAPPNVAVIAQPALLQSLATAGNLVPLSAETRSAVQSNYAQSWIDLGSVDGELYGVWFKAANKSTIWYNADIYAEAGASPATDWDDFLAQLHLVQDSGYAGIAIGADIGWPLTDWFENVYLRTAGGEKYDQLTNHEIPWTDDSVREALEVLATLFGSDVVIPGAAQLGFVDSVTAVFSADPQAGTVYEGDFVAGVIAAETPSVVGQNALFYDFPSIGGSAPAVVGGGDVAIQFTDDAATNALMAYLASAAAAEIWVPLGGLTSPNKAVNTALYPDDISRQIAEALTAAETFRFDMSDLTPSAFGGTVGQGFWQEMINFFENPSDIDGALQRLEAAAQAAY